MTYKQQMKLLREQQKREQAWSARQAQRQMDFQREMSSTAHQREVSDLQAAGLNPVISAGGSGAATGNGAMASSDSLLPEMMEVLRSAVASHGSGGTKVIVNPPEDIPRPSQYFTPRQMEQGTHAGQGAYHGSAKGTERAVEHAEDALEKAKEELRNSFSGISFNAGVRGSMRGTILPTASGHFTGEQAITVIDAYKKVQNAAKNLTRLKHYERAAQNQKFLNNLKKQVYRLMNMDNVDPEAKKRLQEIIY